MPLTNIIDFRSRSRLALVDGQYVETDRHRDFPIAQRGLRRALSVLGEADEPGHMLEVLLPAADAISFLRHAKELGGRGELFADADGSDWCRVEAIAKAETARELIAFAYGLGCEQDTNVNPLWSTEWWAPTAA